MRAAVIEVGGPPAALQIAHVADPRPGDTDVLISVSHISIEGGDLAERRNRQGGSPHVIGYAASGTIVEVGRQVTRFKVGQRVTTFASSGSHAELRAAPAATTFLVPDGLDMGVAAAMPCGPGTAALALQLGRLQAGETALITGATGGVGLAAVQLAALAGARVIGAARHRESLARLKHFGLSDAVVSGGIVADLSLDKAMLQHIVAKKV